MTVKSKSSSQSSAFCLLYFRHRSARSLLHWLAPWSELCIALVTVKKRSVPCMTCQSVFKPRSRISGTRVPKSSATPPPKAVALRCSTLAPFSSPAGSRISVVASSPMIRSYCLNFFGRTGTAENAAQVYGTSAAPAEGDGCDCCRRLEPPGSEEAEQQPEAEEKRGGEHHQGEHRDVANSRADVDLR